jgi:hypothetical protein
LVGSETFSVVLTVLDKKGSTAMYSFGRLQQLSADLGEVAGQRDQLGLARPLFSTCCRLQSASIPSTSPNEISYSNSARLMPLRGPYTVIQA